MGIQGLLPLLKSIQRPTELKKFDGETLGVDAYGWLHRGAISCAIELAQGKPTRKYVDFAMHRVRMAKHFGVTPYLVFDGDFLPSKANTEAQRAKRREESRKAGLELLKAGKPSQAHLELQKAIDVTPEMARHLIEELKKANIPYVVAPYEADAQMVYLERRGVISGIISEDSDLLVFGAKRLLTKLDQHGQCVEVNRRDFCSCREISLTGWTDAEFRRMAILSGCDYLDSIPGLGLKTAYRMIRKHKTPEKVVRMLQFDGKHRVPPDYLDLFNQAELTFLYQRVYCPEAQEQVHLTPPTPDIKIDEMPFIGSFVEPEMARSIAVGDVNPITKEKIILSSLPEGRKRAASSVPRPVTRASGGRPPVKPIDNYFKGDRRIPLGQMDPNCFTIDPQRVSTLTENGQRPIVFPLPRPYVDESTQPSRPLRPYVTRTSTSPRPLRRRTEPVSNLLRNGGATLNNTSRRQTAGPEMEQLNGVITSGGSSNRPPKKARLCDDATVGLIPGKERSKFFSVRKDKSPPRRKTDTYIMSDDSIDEALKSLPDVDGWHTKPQKMAVFDEGKLETNDGIPKDDDGWEADESLSASTAETEMRASTTPIKSTITRFTFNQAPNASVSGLSGVLSSTQSSTTRSTPASSSSSSVYSSKSSIMTRPSTRSTPATPLLTPLQRLGVQAMNRKKEPPTPTFIAPRPLKKSCLGRLSLDSLPSNPSFVPLPPVDLEEVEALHEPVGSEDMIIPESENEDAGDFVGDQENMGKKVYKTGGREVDLSRFMFA